MSTEITKQFSKSTQVLKALINYIWDDKTQTVFYDWLRLVFSYRGIWCFTPAVFTIFFVYWAEVYFKPLILKTPNEVLAIFLMSIVVALFLTRSFRYRLEIDYILLIWGLNFLCREIHFAGTGKAVYIVTVFLVVWVIYRKDYILANIENAKLFQLALTGTIFTYFIAILIQRRVFTPERIPLLPNEQLMHVALEEVMENVAHAYFIFCGVSAFFSIPNDGSRKAGVLPSALRQAQQVVTSMTKTRSRKRRLTKEAMKPVRGTNRHNIFFFMVCLPCLWLWAVLTQSGRTT